jgi:iron-sulfur cluster repair protein YtfE (RIC family)
MSECTCTHEQTPAVPPASKLSAEVTVGEAKKQPGALDVLQRFGINHCCGAHLPLHEAAAPAGVHVEEVLEALAAARDQT